MIKNNRRYGIDHMRRFVIYAIAAIGQKAKYFSFDCDFLHWADVFRSISYAFHSTHPKITNNLPINIVNDITNFCFRYLPKPYTEALARSKANF